jgi:hypothetical protein
MNTIVPVRTVSEANRRDHWAKKAKRAKEQRLFTGAHLRLWCDKPALPCTIVLTRISSRALDDDNLRGALKAVRDSIAEWLGVDDGPTGPITWEYAQERGKGFGVRIDVVRAANERVA